MDHQDDDRRLFDMLAGRLLRFRMEFDPVWATGQGETSFDHALPDPSREALGRHLEALAEVGEALAAFDPDRLDPDRQVDREVLRTWIRAERFRDEVLESGRRDPLPLVHRLGEGLHQLVARRDRPERERREAFTARLAAVPGYLETGALELSQVPTIHAETALAQLGGLHHLFHVLDDGEDLPAGHAAAVDAADAALSDFRHRLESELLPRSRAGAWRLGEERWTEKRRLELDSGLPEDEIPEATFQEICLAQAHMLEASRDLLGGAGRGRGFRSGGPLDEDDRAVVCEALEVAGRDRCGRYQLVDECRAAVDEVRAFVVDRDLVGPLPPDRLRVEESPEFSRGVAVASLHNPGPLDPPSAESFFYMDPVPEAWSEARSDSFLAEYNRSQLRVLAAHETYPGHFVQLALARSSGRPQRAAFGSGTFIEGWAVYSEEVMLEAGFRQDDPRFRLAFWKMRLRTALNERLDRGLHTGELDPGDALRMLRVGGFQEAAEAEGKVRRAQLTSCQLSEYLLGLFEVRDLRDRYRARTGSGFSLPAFHRDLLARGSLPPRHLGRLLWNAM